MYVIVVDDQKPVGDQLVDRLVRQGYPARHFTDAQFFSPGSETASIGFGDTTAVLADFHMGVSGLDVLAEASARNPRMPLALCTATLPAARLLELNADPRCQQAGLAVGKKGPHLGNLLLMAQEALLDPAFRPEDRTQLLRELAKDYPPTLSASQETAHLVCGLVRTYVNTMQSVLSSLRSDFRLEDWPTWQRVGAGFEARVSSLAQMC